MKMIIDKYLSDKLRNFSFLGAVMVVVQHSYAESSFSQMLVTRTLTRMAVPMFFAMSGFLLYKDFDLTFKWWASKVRSRVATLLVPYFAWAIVSILTSIHQIPAFDFVWWVKALGITGSAPMFAGHLWYVKMLMLFVIFALPLAFVLKKMCLIAPIISIMVFCFLGKSSYWSSFFWFSMGSLISLNRKEIDHWYDAATVKCLFLLGGGGNCCCQNVCVYWRYRYSLVEARSICAGK